MCTRLNEGLAELDVRNGSKSTAVRRCKNLERKLNCVLLILRTLYTEISLVDNGSFIGL